MASYSVVWSPTAKLSYYQILEYLDENWTLKEMEFFIKRTQEVLNYISQNPLLYPYSKDSDIHRSVIINKLACFIV